MGVTHVIRGEDLINVTPKVLLLRHALGVSDDPVFAHLPLIVNDKRQKLSKRRDDVSVGDYINRGIPAEAMANYLALLGWGPPDGIEQRPMAEMVELFDLAAVSSSSAAFDVRKLEHLSGDKIRLLGVDEFIDRSGPWLTGQPRARSTHRLPRRGNPTGSMPAGLPPWPPWCKSGCTRLPRCPGTWRFCSPIRFEVDDTSWAKVMGKEGAVALAQMQRCAAQLAALDADGWRAGDIEQVVFAVDADSGLLRDDGEPNRKRAQAPVRVAVLGASVGPPLWESLEVLGRPTRWPGSSVPCSGWQRNWGGATGWIGSCGVVASSPPRAPRRRFPVVMTSLLVIAVVVIGYVAVTFAQVWLASDRDDAQPADAVVVLGAAQWDGRPSPVFQQRLDHAAELHARGLAPVIVVTGGSRPGSGHPRLRCLRLPAQLGHRRRGIAGGSRRHRHLHRAGRIGCHPRAAGIGPVGTARHRRLPRLAHLVAGEEVGLARGGVGGIGGGPAGPSCCGRRRRWEWAGSVGFRRLGTDRDRPGPAGIAGLCRPR